jgi:hypothetical protein
MFRNIYLTTDQALFLKKETPWGQGVICLESMIFAPLYGFIAQSFMLIACKTNGIARQRAAIASSSIFRKISMVS